MNDTTSTIVLLLVVLVAYVLPIIHVWRSDRTPPKVRVFWIIAVWLFGPGAYAVWLLMTMAPKKTAALAAGANDVPPDGKAIVRVVRSSFFGALVKYRVFIDDKTTERTAIRGTGCKSVVVDPGTHTLWVKGYRWLEFPFEAQAGQTLAFSLDAKMETALTNTVVGWI